MPPPGPSDRRFREYTRAPLSAPVRLQFDALGEPEEGKTANISIGGMFVESPSPQPVGTLVRFELQLSDGEPIKGVGEVVWIRHRFQGPEAPAGIGIQFGHLDEPTRDRLKATVLEALGSTDADDLSDPAADSAVDRRSPASRPTAPGDTARRSTRASGVQPKPGAHARRDRRPERPASSRLQRTRKEAKPSPAAISGRTKVLIVILALLVLVFLLVL